MIRTILMALALTGCTSGGAQPMPEPQLVAKCDADKARGIVGQAFTAESAEAARLAATARTLRLVRPGMAVTMDYRGDRLTIDVDERDVVTSLRCG